MKKRYKATITIEFDVVFDPRETPPEEVEIDIADTAESALSVYEGVYHRAKGSDHVDVKLTERHPKRSSRKR